MGGVNISTRDKGYDLARAVLIKNLILTADTGTYNNGEVVNLGDTNKGVKYTDGAHTVGDKLLIIVDDLKDGAGVDTTGADKVVTALSIGQYRESDVTPTLTDATKARLSFSGIELT